MKAGENEECYMLLLKTFQNEPIHGISSSEPAEAFGWLNLAKIERMSSWQRRRMLQMICATSTPTPRIFAGKYHAVLAPVATSTVCPTLDCRWSHTCETW